MRPKRLSILVPCLLIAIVPAFIFLHAQHRHESVAAAPPSPPTVAVAVGPVMMWNCYGGSTSSHLRALSISRGARDPQL